MPSGRFAADAVQCWRFLWKKMIASAKTAMIISAPARISSRESAVDMKDVTKHTAVITVTNNIATKYLTRKLRGSIMLTTRAKSSKHPARDSSNLWRIFHSAARHSSAMAQLGQSSPRHSLTVALSCVPAGEPLPKIIRACGTSVGVSTTRKLS